MSILPLVPVEASTKSPEKLVIYSAPKSGKTTAASLLKDCLLLDFENGSNFVTATKMKVIGIVAPTTEDDKEGRMKKKEYYLTEVIQALRDAKNPYRYIGVDTTTGLESMCLEVALTLYQQTPMGKSFKGNVLTLPNGAGYLYLRQAFDKIVEMIEGCCERIILFGHLKEKVTEVGGKEVSSKDIDLTGKIKNIACAKADAVAYLYRKGNKVILNFKTSEDITCGARPEHLRNKEVTLTESDAEGNITAYWDRIFVD